MHWWRSFQRRRIEICGRIVKRMLSNCSEMLFLARSGRPDILWSVIKLARSITKWTKACDKRLSRLISYIHHTFEFWQYCHVGNTAKQRRLGLFQDSDFARDVEDSQSTSGGTLCIFGSHTFVPISWMCKKQTSVSHSSTEAEIISLDAGLRLDGIPALDLWDLIVAVLHGNTYQRNQERWDPCTNLVSAAPHKLHMRKKCHGMIDDPDNVDFISSSVHSSRQEALLCIFEDNEAVIKMIIKGRSPTMRHVSRTHRIALDWLFDRINSEPKIQIKYIDTKIQLADILTKGNFTRHEWNHLLFLFNISHFSSTNCLEVMSKRTQEDAGEERVTAKKSRWWNWSRDTAHGIQTCLLRLHQKARRKPYQSQIPLSSWNEQKPRTGRLVMNASSSNYSERNIDDKWSFQEWKSGEMLEARTVRPVRGQQFTQDTDQFVIDDDDMDSDIDTESNFSLVSRSFLHRVNYRLRKILDHSSEDAMQDIDKRSLIWWMFMSSTLEASVFMGKNYSENLHSIKNRENNLTLKKMFEQSEKL